jgi:hypothetical protein
LYFFSWELVCSVHFPICSVCCWFLLGLVFWAPCKLMLLISFQVYRWLVFFYNTCTSMLVFIHLRSSHLLEVLITFQLK